MESDSESEKYEPGKIIRDYLELLKSGGEGNQAEIETLEEVAGDIKTFPQAGRAIESHFGQVAGRVQEMVGSTSYSLGSAWEHVVETSTAASDTNAPRLATQHVSTRALGEVRVISMKKGDMNLDTDKMLLSSWYINEKLNVIVSLRKIGEELMINGDGNAFVMQKGTYDLLKTAYLDKVRKDK